MNRRLLLVAATLVIGDLRSGLISATVALNLVLLLRCYQLLQNTDRPHAVTLYKYSMLYLALLFLLLAVPKKLNYVF